MAVALTSEEDSHFSAGLNRSQSQAKLTTERSDFRTSSSTSRLGDFISQASRTYPGSTGSSTLTSPSVTHVESADEFYLSTPVTSSSLASDCAEANHTGLITTEDIILPNYDDGGYFGRLDSLEPPPSPQPGGSDAMSPHEQPDWVAASRPGSPDILERAEDDISVRAQPSRHVDYFSHDWREEDIWSSWKFIVSRRGDYTNSARLENASWRTWMKARNNLSTVSAETLNWLKDHDVTWLYGPLQTGTSSVNDTSRSSNSTKLSKSSSFINKKPILKKRSMSEIMLQRSLSTSSLVKQAAAAVQAQQQGNLKRIGRRPGLERANTDYITFPFSSRGVSHDGTSLFPSTRSSGIVSPSGGRKHIHFNEQVSQCIAVDVKEDDEDDDTEMGHYQYDSESDDGAIMMKQTQSKRRPILKKTPSHNNGGESKTIAMLPSTTLKYREDTPEPTESAMKHSTGLRSPALSPSSSQETLRPSKKSGKLFFAGDEDDEDDDDMDNDGSKTGIYSSLHYSDGGSGLRRSVSSVSLSGEPAGMRRTSSGMFMPLEEGEPGPPGDGLIGRIIDTVNTARDIAHVIWNVGWRS